MGLEPLAPRGEEAPQCQHRRCLAAVVGADKQGRLVGKINTDRKQLAEVGYFNVFDVHGSLPQQLG